MSKDQKKRGKSRKIINLQKHPDPYVTTSDLAGYWRVSRKQIYKQIDAGTLQAIRLGPRLLRISTAEAIRFEDKAKMSRLPEHIKPHDNGDGFDGSSRPPSDAKPLRVPRRRRRTFPK
jgi:excisionase family DNA binding protein